MIPIKSKRGEGLVVLIIIISILVLVYFGWQSRKDGENTRQDKSVVETGIDATNKSGDLRDKLNSRTREIEELQDEI